MGGVTKEDFCTFHQRFTEGGMRVHDGAEIMDRGPHFNGYRAFTNELAGTMADNSDTENPLGNRVDDELSGTVGPIVGEGPAAGTPGEFDHLNLDPLGLGLGFSQTHPSHFGIGEDHRRD